MADKENNTSVLNKETIQDRGNGSQGASSDQVDGEIESFLRETNQFINFNHEKRSFITVLTFVTRLPGPRNVGLHPGFLMRGMCYFPAVGAIVGLVAACTFDIVNIMFALPPIVAAAVSTANSWRVTGCLHEDGLSDSADGIGGGWSKDQILKIMSDSRVGVYGCATLCLYIITKLQLLAALGSSHWALADSFGAGPGIVVAQTAARLTSPYLIHTREYVDDEEGPKTTFYGFMIRAKYLVSIRRVVFAIATSVLVTTLILGIPRAVLITVATLIFAHGAGGYAQHILGGVMGDYLGATICLAELLILSLFLLLKEDMTISELDWILLQESILEFLKDAKSAVLLRALGIYLTYVIWRLWVTKINNALVTNQKYVTKVTGEPGESSPPPSPTEAIMSDPNSTFLERYQAAKAYMDGLAKPVGSLGTLESWAARLAALQRTLKPDASKIACLIFAGDHGVAAPIEDGGEACSAYPQPVTKAVLVGLERGVAGASVLCRTNGIPLRTVDVGVIARSPSSYQTNSTTLITSPSKMPAGTKNFCVEPAMTPEECQRCIEMGRHHLLKYLDETSATAVVLGEVGIGNTTSSAAIIAALTKEPVETICGGGALATHTLDTSIIEKKVQIVKRGLDRHLDKKTKSISDLKALEIFGGAEIAAMVGAILEASERNVGILVDGFIATTAAMVAAGISPSVCRLFFLATESAELGQQLALRRIQDISRNASIPLEERPALCMGLRMGEATGALLAAPILQQASAILSEMATIQDILSHAP